MKIETEKLAKIFLIASIIFCFSAMLGTIKTVKDLAVINNPLPILKSVSALATNCKTDSDCSSYLSYNTCEVFCANKDKQNQKIINEFEKICDSALWYAPVIDCRCINNKCELKAGVKKCKGHGEIPNYILGEDISIQCCDGLVHRTQKKWYDNNCNNLFEIQGSGGYAGVCLSCGDGKCDVNYESSCNCSEDCGEEIDIAGWQTYRSNEYGFEVKYPNGWATSGHSSGLLVLKSMQEKISGAQLFFAIKIKKNYEINSEIFGVAMENISIGGRSGYKYFYQEGAGTSEVILIQLGKDALELSLDYFASNGGAFNDTKITIQGIINPILSTFKFIK